MYKEKIMLFLEQNLTEERIRHSKGVADTAVKMANIYNISSIDAEVAGLLHDCAKNLKDEELLLEAEKYDIMVPYVWRIAPQLLHGPVGASFALNNFPEISRDIYNAIYYHTTGRANMSNLEKIIYIADIIEPHRDFKGVTKLRDLVGSPLDYVTVRVMDSVLAFLLEEEQFIDPQTIKARNRIYDNLKQ